ncbi:MAG: DNA repair protein RadA [Acidimicrobiales bacterium]
MWGSIVEEVVRATPRAAAAGAGPMPLHLVATGGTACQPTGVIELDRVLGGGLVPGSVTLLGGEPGIGKSTLLLQVLASLAASGGPCLLVSAEESAPQVRIRAGRLGAVPEGLLVLAETSLPAILDAIDSCRPTVCVIDSIQTVLDPDIGSAPGSVAQVRECAHAFTRVAKERGIAVVLVGHVTKDGALAGPRVLEHVVDTVLSFEGDRHHALRLLRAVKHRFGATGELGLFEMTDLGMIGVEDPSGLLLGDRRAGVAGSAVVTALEGRRPLVVEVQSLVGPSGSAGPRRSGQGIDNGRLALLIAVLERRVSVALSTSEVFVSAVGGVKLTEPAADLGIALALASAVSDVALPDDLVAFGEVGLGGELRQVPHGARRLAEAARLGFTQAIVPTSAPPAPAGLDVIRVSTLGEAIDRLGLRAVTKAPSLTVLAPFD